MAEDTEKTEKKKDSFNWLRRENRGPTYISYSPFSKLSATSFEFGADGCVASCNAGGELLHLAAPSKNDGLIFVRGDFQTSLYSSLARAQGIFGGPSTFGFEVAVDKPPYSTPKPPTILDEHGSSFQLGELIEQGSFNYRWPFSEYSLLFNDDKKEKTGTCVMFSFVKDGILYQVIRIEEGCAQDSVHSERFPEKSQIALNIGGPLWFQSFASPCRLDGGKLNAEGDVRDVSPESTKPSTKPQPTGSPESPAPDESTEPVNTPRKYLRILDTSSGLGLEAWVFQLRRDLSGADEHYEQLDLTESLLPVDSGPESGETYDFHIPGYTAFGKLPDTKDRRDATFVAAFRLTEVSQVREWISKTKEKESEEQKLKEESSNETESKENEDSKDKWGKIVPGIKKKDWIKQKRDPVEWENRQPDELSKDDWPEGLLWPEDPPDWLTKLPSSSEIYDYVGASPRSVHATGAMWETAFLERERKTDSASELAEVRLLGRCLEKILQVDLVPEPTIPSGTALVSNVFSWANVDLKAMFWKLRYLVKVYKFLLHLFEHYPGYVTHTPKTDESITDLESEIKVRVENDNAKPPKHSNDQIEEMMLIAEYQLKRVHKSIESVTRYLIQALLTPKLDTILMPDDFVPGESNYYYVIITLWYIAKNYPWEESRANWLTTLCENAEKSKDNKPRLYDLERLPKDNCNFGKDARDRIPLLMWYHYSSLLSLYENGWLPDEWDEDEDELKQKVARLGKVANVSTAAKLSSNQTYAPEDEIVDRLAFLAHELGLETSDGSFGTVTSLTKRRVKQRDYTRFINPGRLLPLEEGSTSSPWEIHALCHHSRLVVFTLEKAEIEDGRVTAESIESFEEYKKKLCEFMNSEATIVSCWEREHSKAFKGWLRSEVTAVVGTTLLQLREMEAPSNPSHAHNSRNITGFDRVAQELIYIEHRMDRELRFLERLTGQSNLPTRLDWLTFRPPVRYHPDNFTISLEDTPQFYKDHFITDISIPIALQDYVPRPTTKGVCIDDLKAAIKKLPGSVSVSDLVAMGHGPSSGQRRFMDHSSSHVASTIRHYYQENLTKLHEAVREAILRDPKDPEHGKETKTGKDREGDLSRSLFDSLVDQQVQHRLLAVRKLSKNLLQMLLYVIHPEAAACLSTHVLSYSRFSSRKGNMWIARITLRSWIQQVSTSDSPAAESQNDVPIILPINRSGADDDAPIIFPEALKDSQEVGDANVPVPAAETTEPKKFKLTVSSLVISTNSFGDFSKLTLMSETIDDSRLVSFATDCQTLWQKFVNQPQTARCLIFLLALGVMCERLAVQYNAAIEASSNILKLDKVFFSVEGDDSKWIEDHESISQFKMGLWGLDTLYKLQRSLKESVGSILQAKAELVAQINEGPDRRSDALQRMCDEYLASFESQLVNLTAVSSNLNRKIEFNSRFKDALSAILALRDGRASLTQNDLANKQNSLANQQNELVIKQSNTSIKQNSTIERLTYLTIAYLPISFMAAILAIPTDHPVSFPFVTRKTTLILVLLILLVTYGMAVLIRPLLKYIRSDDPTIIATNQNPVTSSATTLAGSPPSAPAATSPESSRKGPHFSLGGCWRWLRGNDGKHENVV